MRPGIQHRLDTEGTKPKCGKQKWPELPPCLPTIMYMTCKQSFTNVRTACRSDKAAPLAALSAGTGESFVDNSAYLAALPWICMRATATCELVSPSRPQEEGLRLPPQLLWTILVRGSIIRTVVLKRTYRTYKPLISFTSSKVFRNRRSQAYTKCKQAAIGQAVLRCFQLKHPLHALCT